MLTSNKFSAVTVFIYCWSCISFAYNKSCLQISWKNLFTMKITVFIVGTIQKLVPKFRNSGHCWTVVNRIFSFIFPISYLYNLLPVLATFIWFGCAYFDQFVALKDLGFIVVVECKDNRCWISECLKSYRVYAVPFL